MRFLLTGGAGFIGSHLAISLVKKGHEVTVLDDLSSGSMENLESVKDAVKIEVGSVSSLKTVRKMAREADVIYHLATQCLIMGMDNPAYLQATNDVGTFNVCQAAKEYGCKLNYIGTSEQYGIQEKFPIREDAPLRPRSLYALTKVLGESYVKYFHEVHKVPAVIIRPFNCYGPLQREDLDMERLMRGFNAYAGVITSFIKRLEKGEPPVIFGNGLQSRDFTYVSDIVDGFVLLGELGDCETVNLGSGRAVSILELAGMMVDAWGADEKLKNVVFKDCRPNDIRALLADIQLARSYGYSPKVPFEDGLKRYVEWYKEKLQAHR